MLVQPTLFHILRNSHNREPGRAVGTRWTNASPNRTGIRIETFGQRFIDNNGTAANRIAFIESTPLDDWYLHRFEITRTGFVVIVNVLHRECRSHWQIFKLRIVGVHRTIGRHPFHRGCHQHTGRLLQRTNEARGKLCALFVLAVIRGRQIHTKRGEIARVKTGVDGGEIAKRAHQQSGANHENHRQHDFTRHQTAAHIMSRHTRGAARTTFFDRTRDDILAKMHQRCEAKHCCGKQSDYRRKQ